MKRDLLVMLLGIAVVAVWSGNSKGSLKPVKPPKITVNPSNGNPISTFGSVPALSQSQLAALAQQAGFTGAAITKAVQIATRESGGHPGAVVDTRGMTAAQLKAYWGKAALPEWSAGLWQINVLAFPQYTVEELQDPTTAAAAVYSISNGGTNWGPWGG